jgi:hypothetical protein
MFTHKRYTVTRISGQYIQVVGENGKAHTLFAMAGDKATPACNCNKMGRCGHQIAAEEFFKFESQPKAQPQSLEEVFAW